MAMPQPHQSAVGRRTEVLQLLRDVAAPMGITEISQRLEMHANTARFHLKTLVNNGQVECNKAAPGTPGRPRQLFRTVRGMDPMGPRHYRILAQVLAATVAIDPDPRRRAIEAGRAWGHRQASTATHIADGHGTGGTAEIDGSVELLVRMLDELGFAPEEIDAGWQSQIRMRNCPFLELAVDRPEVVCPVHLGLMRGAMESWDSPITVDRLDPFVEPDLCRVHLSAVRAS